MILADGSRRKNGSFHKVNMDFLTTSERSRRMALIRKRDTSPEITVRSIVHRLGYRFRVHVRRLPGTPDLVFTRLRKIIDVRGCFWHSHSCRRLRPRVSTRTEYWHPKLQRNVQRDRRNQRALRALGWEVFVVWECETRDAERLIRRLQRFLATKAFKHSPVARGGRARPR
jgi:DNA mismatch endonuclease (patch repair protein)